MKKLIVGLLAAFLMTSGLVAFTGAPASARPADCPYSGCVDTRTNASANVVRTGANITVRVRAVGSNLVPKGKITLTITKIKKNGNKRAVRTIFSRLSNGTTTFNVRGLKPGTYSYDTEYENNEKFGFNYSTDSGKFTVKRR